MYIYNNKKSNFPYIIIFIIFINLFLPLQISSPFALLIGIFIFIFHRNNINISKFYYIINPILFLLCISLNYSLMDILRDISFIVSPIMMLYVGYWSASKYSIDHKVLVKLIITLGFFFALFHFITIYINYNENGNIDLKLSSFGGGYIVSLGCALLIAESNKFSFFRFIFINVLLISVLTSNSRTEILILFMALFFLLRNKSIYYLFSILFLLFTLLIFLIFNENIEIFSDFSQRLFNSFSELQLLDVSEGDRQLINDNWRGFESSIAIFKVLNSNLLTIIFGNGLGYRLDLGFDMELGQGIIFDSIPIFHNGYIYLLLKTGVVGFLLCLIFFYRIFKLTTSKSINKFSDDLFITNLVYVVLFSIIISMFVVMGIFQGSGSDLLMLLGILIFNKFSSSNT